MANWFENLTKTMADEKLTRRQAIRRVAGVVAGTTLATWLPEQVLARPEPIPHARRGTWSLTGSMSTYRAVHTATLLPNGTILVAGGYGPGFLALAELYDPSMGTWLVTGAMIDCREGHTATLLKNGKVLAAGGNGCDSDPVASAELYHP